MTTYVVFHRAGQTRFVFADGIPGARLLSKWKPEDIAMIISIGDLGRLYHKSLGYDRKFKTGDC